jgi:peptide/nickel transport system ATP-binding protein
MTAPLLSVRGLDISYRTQRGTAQALRGIDFDIPENAFVGLVGESGSGKSSLALALMGLLPANARLASQSIRFDGKELNGSLGALRGSELAMVFQDPMSALNPLFQIGTQMVDIQRRRFPDIAAADLRRRALRMLDRVGVPAAEARLRAYPHELSGGMRQRVIIAMALLVEPRLLIADEPTTALDATVEAQIVELLREIRRELKGSVLFVSHSLGLVADLCDHVIVMYGGTIVESGPSAEIFARPRHPYTQALLSCEIDPYAEWDVSTPFVTIPGTVPDLVTPPQGCIFQTRCPAATAACAEPPPVRAVGADHQSRCWLS